MSKVQGTKYQSDSGPRRVDWRADEGTPLTGFACLRFTIDDPQYYLYNFASTNQSAAGGHHMAPLPRERVI